MARAGVAPVATAADLVCGAFTPRHVAVCVFGAPIVPRGRADSAALRLCAMLTFDNPANGDE